ncbi:MAG: hypothetical protein ACOH5I_15610 [Oligoflexus sp.]
MLIKKYCTFIGLTSLWILTACGQAPSLPQGTPASKEANSANRSIETAASAEETSGNEQVEPTISESERLAQIEQLEQQKAELEAERAVLQAEMDKVSEQRGVMQAQAAQIPGAPIANFQAAAFLDNFDLAALNLDAIDDLIQAAMDADVAGIIDALMDLAAALGADLAVIDDAIAAIQDQIADLN